MSSLNKKPLLVGITGSIGSGKSIISHIFEILDIPVYYSDIEAKKLYDDLSFREKLLNTFGEKIFDKEGVPDKKLIAQLVFHDASALQKLNKLIHPAVKANFFEWIEKQGLKYPYLIQESALIFETGFNSLFDKVITVYAEKQALIKRIQKRDNLTEEEISARIKNQMLPEEKKKLADFIIMNNETELVMPQILSIHKQLIRLS